jgi:hypothetical protein
MNLTNSTLNGNAKSTATHFLKTRTHKVTIQINHTNDTGGQNMGPGEDELIIKNWSTSNPHKNQSLYRHTHTQQYPMKPLLKRVLVMNVRAMLKRTADEI